MPESAAVMERSSAAGTETEAWAQVALVPCRLAVDVPLPGFTVADALQLRRNSIVNSRWPVAHDIPLRINGQLVARGQFEVLGNHLAVRLTELTESDDKER